MTKQTKNLPDCVILLCAVSRYRAVTFIQGQNKNNKERKKKKRSDTKTFSTFFFFL
jgi:hypothetical protein